MSEHAYARLVARALVEVFNTLYSFFCFHWCAQLNW